MQLYTDDNQDTFPPHRNNGMTSTAQVLTNWWGTTIIPDGNLTNLFHCHSLKSRRQDLNVQWEWAFDAHKVGYGYNAYFQGSILTEEAPLKSRVLMSLPSPTSSAPM